MEDFIVGGLIAVFLLGVGVSLQLMGYNEKNKDEG